MLVFIELILTDGAQEMGSQMISPIHISEVEEVGSNVRLHMASGNSYLVTGESFGGMLSAIEGSRYLKMKTEDVESEEVKEVEGELVD